MAGISAAKTLRELGITNIMVILYYNFTVDLISLFTTVA